MSDRSSRSPAKHPFRTGALLVAVLCASAPGCIQTAAGRGEAPALEAPAELTFEQWASVDARGAAAAMAKVRRDIEGLDAAARAKAADSLAVLQVTCPYTRATLQLALALDREVQHLQKEHFDGLVHPDVDYLKRGLADHVAVLNALQVQLPLPQGSDGLYRLYGTVGLVDRAQLAATEHPIAVTAPLVDAVPTLVEDIPYADMEAIRKHSGIVDRTTGHPWTFQNHLMGWRTTLTRVEPFVQDEAARRRVRGMLDALDAIAGMGC